MSVQVIVSHHVTDFEAWKPVFKEHEQVRIAHHALGHALYRSMDDPGRVVIVNDFADETGARAFLADPSLAEAMKRAGVDVKPDVYVCHQVESVAY